MAYQDQFYTLGTVKVTNGSPTVTGTGTGWETALIKGGVFYAGGGAYPIATVDSETTLTLAIPYTGLDADGVAYAIDRQRSQATSAIAMNERLAQIIREINVGNIEGLNALNLIANQIISTDGEGKLSQSAIQAWAVSMLALAGAENKFPYLNAANQAALADITALGRSILADQTGAAVWGHIGGVRSGAPGTGYYVKLPDKTLIQWGQVNLPDGAHYGQTVFPTSFDSADYVVVGINGNSQFNPGVMVSRNPDIINPAVFGWRKTINGAATTVIIQFDFLAIGRAP